MDLLFRQVMLLIFFSLNPNPMDLVDLFLQVMLFKFFSRCLKPFKTLIFLFRVAILGHLLKHSHHFKARAISGMVQCLKIKVCNDRDEATVLNDRDEATVQDSLNLLIELAKTEPRFFRRQLVKVVGNMLQIAEAQKLKDRTRHLAIEVIITSVEAREQEPVMMKDLLDLFISRLFEVLMTMLSDVEWNDKKKKVQDAGQSRNYSVGKECLRRLATTLGGNTIFQVVQVRLKTYFTSRLWQENHAILVALAQIAKGRSTAMFPKLNHMGIMVLGSSRNAHARCAAVNAIGVLSANLCEAINEDPKASMRLAAINVTVKLSDQLKAPDLHYKFQKRVLPALFKAIEKDPNANVKSAASKATDDLSTNWQLIEDKYVSSVCRCCGTTVFVPRE